MQIGDFNIRYNELHPDVCYAYELFDDANTEWAINQFIIEMEYHLKRLKALQAGDK